MKRNLYCCFFIGIFLLGIQKTFSQKYRISYTVATDGSGDFRCIQKAVEACKAYPDQRITIHIKNGIYKEKVRIPIWNPSITLVGENRDSTVIRYGDYFGSTRKGGNSTFYTATLSLEAVGTICQNLTIENSAGPVGQALALSVSGDRCQLVHCRILGNQDSFFATGESTRVYVSGCYIEGTTDFIFGDATVLFTGCQIYGKANSYITAASTNKGQLYGLVFDHCQLMAAPSVTRLILGRPWRSYAKTAYLYCQMGSFIDPKGWDNWRDPHNETTTYYAEYGTNNGEAVAAATDGRASWAHSLTKAEAATYTIQNIFGGSKPWVPSYSTNHDRK